MFAVINNGWRMDGWRLYHVPLRTLVLKSSHAQIFLSLPRRKVIIYFCQKGKKNNWGSTTSFWRENASKNTPNLKNRASLANKATVSVSPKILQLNLWIEISLPKIVQVDLLNELSQVVNLATIVSRTLQSFLIIFGQCVDHYK